MLTEQLSPDSLGKLTAANLLFREDVKRGEPYLAILGDRFETGNTNLPLLYTWACYVESHSQQIYVMWVPFTANSILRHSCDDVNNAIEFVLLLRSKKDELEHLDNKTHEEFVGRLYQGWKANHSVGMLDSL